MATYRELRYRGTRFAWSIYGGPYRVNLVPSLWRTQQAGRGWRAHHWTWLGVVFAYRWWPRR